MGGLTAAYRLHQAGKDVHVYEARPRVGGRVLSIQTDGHVAELGAQNIADGGKAENILRLIHEFQLEIEETQVELDNYYFDGKQFISVLQLLRECRFKPERLKEQLAELASKSKNMQEILQALFGIHHPLYKILSVRLAAYEGGSVEKLSSCYTSTLYHMLLGGIAGVHQKKGREETYITLLNLKKGNGWLAEALASPLKEKLHLGNPLTALEKEPDGSYLLSFKNRHKEKADIVVLAIPCSTFAGIDFGETVIPPTRLKKIQQVCYGENSKIVVPYRAAQKARSIVHNLMVGFSDASHGIITMYYVGKASKFTPDSLKWLYHQDKNVMDLAWGSLATSPLDPEYAKEQQFATYHGPVGYSWTSDPYAQGSYSYIAAGHERELASTTTEDGEVVKTLFAPVSRTLYFAGEHASTLTDTPGTMEAACESGEKVARLISNMY